MKRRILTLLLTLVMVLSLLPGTALAVNDSSAPAVTYADLADINGTALVPDGAGENTELTVADAVRALLLWTGMTEQQLGSFPDDYLAQARSMGMIDTDTDADAPCTLAAYRQMKAVADQMYDALHANKLQPLYMNGMAQPIFPYTTGEVDGGLQQRRERHHPLLRLCRDQLRHRRRRQARPRQGARADPARSDGGQLQGGHHLRGAPVHHRLQREHEPRRRTSAARAMTSPSSTASRTSACPPAPPRPRTRPLLPTVADWYYWNPYEQMYDYEDLNWYDYYLVRGFAVVECGGLGTKGSDGFETCGTDLEIDAFKCVIEWLHGDRVAYTDKTSNVAISADWSSGKVGMTGRSYAGTTQFGLATTGVAGLETIVPVAGIASWYEYTNSQGISTNSLVNYSERLGWYCNGRYLDPDDYATIAEKYGNYMYQIQQDQLKSNGDYSEHWATRDYTLDAENIKCPALIVHGLNDDNVRTKEFDLMYQAYQKAGVNVKLLLHQDAHLTPSYPAGNLEFYIDGESYNNVLNRWFSHYLCGVENGAENMAAVTAQSNVDASVWNTYDSWTTDESIALSNADDTGTTTINSDYATQGINRRNWRDALTAGSTDVSAMYTMDVDADTVIKGSVAVSFTASADNYDAPETTSPRGTVDHDNYVGEETNALDHDNYVGAASADGAVTVSLPDGADLIDRDALMVSAMLVDIAPEGTTFPAYNTQGSYVPKTITAGGAWMGGGLNNYDYAELNATDVSYKIIARGWMDLCNPGAGYDSASAGTKVALKVGENHDYTIYLQPNLYTVKEGHKLALVIYTYEPGKANYSQDYQITLENASVSAEIPVDKIPAVPALPFTDVPADTELYAAVKWAYFSAPQITVGVTETTFAPASTCTRAEVVTFLYRLAGEPDVSGTALPFTDVAEDAYYTDAVKWAAANGVTAGTSATTFSPNDTCTRAQAVTLLYNAAGAPAVSDTVSFADVAADAYYADAVAWAAANGVTVGTSATTFSPDDACTRGQIVCMLYRGDTQA